MIDFHSHILPGVDDGSKNIEESKKIILEARDLGFEKIISTSHYAYDCYEIPEYKRKEMIIELNQEEDFPEIILGSEIFASYNMLDFLKEGKASTINGTNYILIELPLRATIPNLKDLIIKLQENNYRLILAHPERYSIIQNDFNYLYELQEMGVLFQCNYASIIGYYGFSAKITVKKILKNELASFLGSDVHRAETIYKDFPKIMKKLRKIISPEYLEKLTLLNAEAILRNEMI